MSQFQSMTSQKTKNLSVEYLAIVKAFVRKKYCSIGLTLENKNPLNSERLLVPLPDQI